MGGERLRTMTEAWLGNPIWAALTGPQHTWACRQGAAARYPADVAPFVAWSGHADVAGALDSLVAPGEAVYLLGALPRLSADWQVQGPEQIVQMVCSAPLAAVDGAPIIELTAAHRADVLALTALVYPHFFRPHTMTLGRYFGIYQGDQLAAMIGERMSLDGYREISAVCTHPDFSGHGHARRLLVWLSNDNHQRGVVPFLHVSEDNRRARRLYARNGYVDRCMMPFWSLHRDEAPGALSRHG